MTQPVVSRRGVVSTIATTLGLLGLQLGVVNKARADNVKLEYMPLLEGKDYGKPR